jgi:hypothetical protein
MVFKADHPGIWVEREPGAESGALALMIRHPTYPFVKKWPQGADLFQIAAEYVDAARGRMRLPKEWISGLTLPPLEKGWTAADPTSKTPPDNKLVLRWFPQNPADPRGSFWFERRRDRQVIDRTGVLLAGFCRDDRKTTEVFFSKPRLRIVFHVREQNGNRTVRFTGMSRSDGQPEVIELEGRALKATASQIARTRIVNAEVFPRDPPSEGGVNTIIRRRLNRRSADLKPAQKKMPLGDLTVIGNQAELRNDDVEVRNSILVKGDRPLGGPKKVKIKPVGTEWRVDETQARTNDFAAVNAYFHARSLFERMASYGIDVADYFQWAERPIYIHYRSGMARATDGRVRNAEVVWAPPPDFENMRKGKILVRLGLADLSNSPATAPLGIGCDVRWNWHEFGHALLMAAVGSREFRFAHSAGDALAAILSDPESELARPEHDAGWRGATFPWVALTRRHDRKPQNGWAWNGILDRSEHGYWKEQILSSTLFRLYRDTGGDARTPAPANDRDEPVRRAAADYTVYLIMRAIRTLGAAGTVPASTPDQFVSALMDADTGTEEFVSTNGQRRVGGTVHKVVRWAFEQQGLYAKPAAGAPVSGPGEPEPVDVYVASDLNGGYAAKQASYQIQVNNPVANQNNTVSATIGNRGANPANSVKVALWAAQVNGGVPDWKDARWQHVGDQPGLNVPPQTVGGGVVAQFQWNPPAAGNYALLAIATCAGDAANTDPETELPCALNGAPIAHLVAGDNNLGLATTVVS